MYTNITNNSLSAYFIQERKEKKGGHSHARRAVCVCIDSGSWPGHTHTQTAVYSRAITSQLRHVLNQSRNSCSSVITASETSEIHSVTAQLCVIPLLLSVTCLFCWRLEIQFNSALYQQHHPVCELWALLTDLWKMSGLKKVYHQLFRSIFSAVVLQSSRDVHDFQM